MFYTQQATNSETVNSAYDHSYVDMKRDIQSFQKTCYRTKTVCAA